MKFLKFWLRGFLSSCLRQLKIPKIWRRALVVAIPKPSKPVEDPQSYCPISLLCVPYKILERLIYNRVETISFTLTTSDSEPSRLRRLKNGVPQGSVLAPLLFSIYIYDLPSISSKKYAYADDLAILYLFGD